MAGDILCLGTEEKAFFNRSTILPKAMDGQGLCLLRLDIPSRQLLRVRRVTVQLGVVEQTERT